MVTGTTEGALDESIIVKMDATVEAFAINLIDSIEVGSCNFVGCLLDASELVFHFVNMVGSDRCHIAAQFQ